MSLAYAQRLEGELQDPRAVPSPLHVKVSRHEAQLVRHELFVHGRSREIERRAHDEPVVDEAADVQRGPLVIARVASVLCRIVTAQDTATKLVEPRSLDALDS